MSKLSSPLSITRIKKKNKIFFFIILILVAAYLAKGYFLASEQRRAGTGALPPYLLTGHWEGHAQEVRNAHTLSVLSPYGEKITIRLYGITGPSRDEPGGREAVIFLAGMIDQGPVVIIPFREDNRGRLIANVHTREDGRNMSEELVKKGLSSVSRDYCRHEICMYWFGLEEDARRAGLGMWRHED